MKRTILAAIVISISSAPAYANVGMDYGFGSREAALAGSGVAGGFDGFAAYQNPAGLPLIGRSGDDRLALSYGLIYMQPSFDDINGIVLENSVTSSATSVGNVNNDYRATFGQVLGISYKLFPDFGGLTLGLVTYLPMNQFDYLDTGESYVPEYTLFRTRTQQPQVDVGIGANVADSLHLGMGLRFSFSVTSSADAFINSAGNGVSTVRFSASVKPVVAPYFGTLFTSPKSDFTLGAVVRLPVVLNYTLDVNTKAAAAGFLPAVPFSFTAASSLTYDPLTVEFGGTLPGPLQTKIYLQLDFQQWNQYQAPMLVIANPQISGCGSSPCGIILAAGPNLDFNTRNIWVPHLGVEKETESNIYRIGYQYHPSIFSSPPNGSGNYLDPDRHIMTAGVGFKFKRFLSYERPWNLDLHAAYQALIAQNITKAPGDENGNPAGAKIGSPGYEAGGKIYGGGASISFVF